jgi:prolipoprotein diacylglyceryltransferase
MESAFFICAECSDTVALLLFCFFYSFVRSFLEKFKRKVKKFVKIYKSI